MSLLEKIRNYGSLIRFSHTIFALPFALASRRPRLAISSGHSPRLFLDFDCHDRGEERGHGFQSSGGSKI